MTKFPIIAALALACLANTRAQPPPVPEHFSIPSDTISPDGRYGVMLPDSEDSDAPDKLVEIETGRVVATLAGDPGWREEHHSMRWGEMEAKWSADSSTLCWIHPDKWFPESFVVLKLEKGQLAWQVDVTKPADREILSRTEAAAPLNFAIAKLDNAQDGSAYPEGFSIAVSGPEEKISLPLVCGVKLDSNPKDDAETPPENGVRAWLTTTVGLDGSLTYSDFKLKPGALSDDAAARIKAAAVNLPMIDTDLGKALLFPGLASKDGHYAVGWTVQAVGKETPPVDWSHWDHSNPDKVLRLYDWQGGGPYEAVDLVLDTRSGKAVQLPAESPYWTGKRDGAQMIAAWRFGVENQRYAIIECGGEKDTSNFWLVLLTETPMQVKDLTAAMRKEVDVLLRDRRPEVSLSDFIVFYPLKPGEEAVDKSGLAEISFVANGSVSDQGEYQLSGTVTIRLSDATVTGASSEQKRLDPFVTNEALKKSDEELNTVFQALLKSLPPKEAPALKKEEREWIVQRDADADQAVNATHYDLTQQACEDVREKSLLASTRKRIEELKGWLK